jgi:hypothetical protein
MAYLLQARLARDKAIVGGKNKGEGETVAKVADFSPPLPSFHLPPPST